MAPERIQISIGEAVAFARSAYARRWLLLTGVLLAMLGSWVVLEVLVITTQRLGIVAWAVEHIAFLLCFAGIEVGLLRISLALQDGQNPRLADAFNRFELAPGFLAAQLLYAAVVLVGLALLVVPGVLVAARFGLFGFRNAAGAGVLDGFRESWNMTRGLSVLMAAVVATLFVFSTCSAHRWWGSASSSRSP